MNVIETTDAHVYAQWYSDYRHSADRQIRNIELRTHRNPFYLQRQRNILQYNNDPRVLTILRLIYINPHINIHQTEHQIGILRTTNHRLLQSSLSHNSCTGIKRIRPQNARTILYIGTWCIKTRSKIFLSCLEMKQHSLAMGLDRHNCHQWILIGINKYFTSIIRLFMFGWEYAMVKSSDVTFLNISSPVQLIYSSFRIICQNILRIFH